MPSEILIFDAASSNIDGSSPGTALNIGPGTLYLLREFSAPAPQQTVQYAGSVDTEGSLPASRKHENRVLTLKVTCTTAVSLRTLQDKIGKVAREGGTLKWQLPNAETVIFDLHAADTFEPTFDVTWQKNAGAYCEVQIGLPAKPYGRGPSVTLSDHTETTSPALVFTETGIKGDMPALGSLVIDNDQAATTQATMIWGLESKDIVSTSIPLFIEAEDTTYITGFSAAADVGPAGASGAGVNKVRGAIAGNGSYADRIAGHFTSIGTFNIYARVQAPSANTAAITLAIKWGNVGSTNPTMNDPVTLDTAWEDSWRLVNLGQVTARKQLLASTGDWIFDLVAQSTTAAQVFYVDYFLIVPIAEGSGIMTDTASPIQPSSVATSGGAIVNSSDAQRYGAGYLGAFAGYDKPASYEGDYLLIPPAGAEARTLRIIVKLSRGELTQGADAGVDDLSARLTYIPRYLVVPSP